MKGLNRICQNTFTMVEKKLYFDDLKCCRTKDFNRISQNIFIKVEENFGFWWSEIHWNEGFGMHITKFLYHFWRKFLDIDASASKKDLNRKSQNFFAMVEEYFEFWWSEMSQKEKIRYVFLRVSSTWLNKSFNFDDLECPQNKRSEPPI